MVSRSTTRRRVLAGIGATIGVSLAGCSAFGGPSYTLHSRPENGTDPVELFTWRPASNAFHYDRADVTELADELRERGTVESIEIPLIEVRGTGETGYVPAYTRHEGEYFRVRVDHEPVTLDRWAVWFEPLDELPDDVEYTTDPEDGLSELDTEIVREARRAVMLSVLDDRDHESQRAYRRGVVFFEPLDPGESGLVPEPSFEYALVEPESHFGPDELALRLHVQEEAVETTRYTHTLEPIATDRDAFVTHLQSEHVAAQFSPDELSSEARDILDESTGLTGYVEEAPLSEPFERLVADLGLADVSIPDGREIASWIRYYEYGGEYFEANLRMSDYSIV